MNSEISMTTPVVVRGNDPVEELHLTYDQGGLGINDQSGWRQRKIDVVPVEKWTFSGCRTAQMTITCSWNN